MIRFVIFAASGAITNTAGKATARLIPHLFSVATVKTTPAPFATKVFIAVTSPVIGSTNKKLCT
jgi:hypothetical protein